MTLRTYRVQARDKEPLLRFILDALSAEGCRVLMHSPPNEAPFRITFETPLGERLGIVCYAFFANSKLTKNRPSDEHRFQVKYGSDDGKLHRLWQDPFRLYTTLFLGINPEHGFFVAADPFLHEQTRFFISIEFKQHQVDQIDAKGWHWWERDHRGGDDRPVEVLVGGTPKSFLRYVRFEREAFAEDQGHRALLAERIADPTYGLLMPASADEDGKLIRPARIHTLAQEFELAEDEVLDLIANARRLKMAVRGWVAEEHLVRHLQEVPGVTDCMRLDEEGSADVQLRYRGSRPLVIECKNVLREMRHGLARIDFQRTRASKTDPCSRYYKPGDFDVLAGCLHAVTLAWEFSFVDPRKLDGHPRCKGRLSNNVKVDERWATEVEQVLRQVAG